MQLPHFHGLQIMAAPNESSEDVNDFLQRIRELGERRDKEDDERTKKLEEEILQGRKERQARRAGMPLSLYSPPESAMCIRNLQQYDNRC